VPRLWKVYPGICLTTEEKAWKNLSQDGQRMPGGTMKIEYTEQSIHNKNGNVRIIFTFMFVFSVSCVVYFRDHIHSWFPAVSGNWPKHPLYLEEPKTFCQSSRFRDLVLLTETAYVVTTIHFNTKYIPAWLVFHFINQFRL
jgi:hypothetical protein